MADNEEQGSARPPRAVVRPFRGPAGGNGGRAAPSSGPPLRPSATPVAGRPAMPPFATRPLPTGATPRRPFTPIGAMPAVREERPTRTVAPDAVKVRAHDEGADTRPQSVTPTAMYAFDTAQVPSATADDTETADVEEYEVEAYAYPELVAEASSDVIDAVVERDHATPHMGVAAFSARYPHLDSAHADDDVDDYRLAAVEASGQEDEDSEGDVASTYSADGSIAGNAGAGAQAITTTEQSGADAEARSMDDVEEISGAAVPLWDERTSAAADDRDGGAAWHARSFADTPVTTPAIGVHSADATDAIGHVVDEEIDRATALRVKSTGVISNASDVREVVAESALADIELAFDASASRVTHGYANDALEASSGRAATDGSDDLDVAVALDAEQDMIVAEVAASRALEATLALSDGPLHTGAPESPTVSLAAALDRVAERVRTGEPPDRRLPAGASDAAILAAALSALLDTRA